MIRIIYVVCFHRTDLCVWSYHCVPEPYTFVYLYLDSEFGRCGTSWDGRSYINQILTSQKFRDFHTKIFLAGKFGGRCRSSLGGFTTPYPLCTLTQWRICQKFRLHRLNNNANSEKGISEPSCLFLYSVNFPRKFTT